MSDRAERERLADRQERWVLTAELLEARASKAATDTSLHMVCAQMDRRMMLRLAAALREREPREPDGWVAPMVATDVVGWVRRERNATYRIPVYFGTPPQQPTEGA